MIHGEFARLCHERSETLVQLEALWRGSVPYLIWLVVRAVPSSCEELWWLCSIPGDGRQALRYLYASET